MPQFRIRIEETLSKEVSVDADSAKEALELVENGWKNSQYILTADDFCNVSFTSVIL